MGRRVKRGYAAAVLLLVGAVILSLAVFSLTACEPMGIRGVVEDLVRGEGDGLTPDTTPPVVESTAPADGATGVALDVQIEVVFSEAMNPDTITADSFAVFDSSTGVAGAVSYISDTNTAIFTPDSQLASYRTYNVNLNNTISDTSGNSLNGYTFSFTTISTGKQWRTAVTIYDSSTGAETPKAGIDSSGNGLVVWIDANDTGVFGKKHSTSTGWASGEDLIRGGGAAVTNLRLSVSPAGYASVVWDDQNPWANYYNGNSWETASSLDASGTDPDVSVTDSGKGMAVWNFIGDSIKFRLYSSGWQLSDPIPDSETDNVLTPRIAGTGTGTYIVLWVDETAAPHKIMTNNYNGAWNLNAEDVGGIIDDMVNPVIAMEPGGRAVAAWGNMAGDIIYGRYYNGSWEGGQAIIVDTASGAASKPSVAINGNGIAYVIYEDAASIKLKRYDGGWAGSMFEVGIGTDPRIQTDDGDNVMVIWKGNDGIYERFYDASAGEWRSSTKISTGTGAASPHLAMNSEGEAISVWIQDSDVWVNHFK